MSRRVRSEDGWAMIAAIGALFVMITLGLATAAIVDTQAQKSGRERMDESDFNLVDGALNDEMYVLSRSWPGGPGNAAPAQCTSSVVQANCPDPNLVKANYNNVDYASAPQWTIQVRDNITGEFYSDSGTVPAPHYDSNGDGKLWVRATATVKSKIRAVVGLVQVDEQTEQLPRSTVLAGSVDISNNGNKPIICTKLPDNPLGNDCDPSSSSTIGPVQVRCSLSQNGCVNERSGGVQISPHVVQDGYTGGSGLSPQALNRLRARAVADGTYYTACPPSLAGPQEGMVIFADLSGGNCSYSGNSDWNSSTKPGLVVFNNGTLSLRGNATFWGVIYIANPPSSPPAVDLGGRISVIGGISIDGNGQLVAGSSKVNLVFDDFAFTRVQSYGAATLVQNKWREFVPSGP